MTFSGFSYLASNLLWWWVAALAVGIIVGWMTFGREKSSGLVAWLVLLIIGILIAAFKLIPGRAGLWFDVAVLFTTAYFVGCWLGSFLRQFFGASDEISMAGAGMGGAAAMAGGMTKPAMPPKPAMPALEMIKPYQWQAMREAKSLTLTGYVPSNEVKTRIMAAAKAMLPNAMVTDRLQMGAGAPSGLETMAGAAFGHLAKLDSGVASLVDGMYTLSGSAPSATNKEAILKMAGSLPMGFMLAKAEIDAPTPVMAASAMPVPTMPTPAMPVPAMPARPMAAEPAMPAPAPAMTTPVMEDKPMGLAAPRGGKADDLKRIRGIGKQNEGRLHGLGIWHFDQIASWTAKEIAWVGHFLAFPGRIEREDWLSQAKMLASGMETEFSKRVDRGEVATSSGGTQTKPAMMSKISAPRAGKPDNLKLLSGVDAAIELKLNEAGVFHFDQIAKLTHEELTSVSGAIGMAGLALQKNWKGEAAILAVGGETDNSKMVRSAVSTAAKK